MSENNRTRSDCHLELYWLDLDFCRAVVTSIAGLREKPVTVEEQIHGDPGQDDRDGAQSDTHRNQHRGVETRGFRGVIHPTRLTN